VIGAIRRWHDSRGVAPRKRDWNKPTFDAAGAPATPGADVVLELFGKWSEAVKAAGLEPERQERSPKERKQGGLPDRAQREYLDDDLYYKDAEASAPYYSPAGTYLAAAEIIAEMYRWTALTGQPPTEREWLRDKQWPHPDVVVDLFGSWDDAMKDAGLDQYEAPPRADADTEELRARLAGLERELQAERQSAERELRSARRTASRLEESERKARVDAQRAEEIARAARDEAKRARTDVARLAAPGAEAASTTAGQTPAGAEAASTAGGLTPGHGGMTSGQVPHDREVEALTERIIELEARSEHLADENERLRRALGQVRAAMGVEDETAAEPAEGAPGEPTTVLEAVQLAADRVQHLVLLPDAFESAEDSPFRRPQLVLDALLKLDELARLYAEPGGIGESIGSVARRLGLDWIPDTTEWGGTRGRHYEVTWKGRKFRLGPHVRLGTGAGAGSTARIYGFFYDGDDDHGRTFVVGHVGRHLPDSTT
jgi:hypothetical protein